MFPAGGSTWENMKLLRIVPAFLVLILSSCTTLQNRRDLFFPQTVEGPYTRMLKDGSWKKKKVAPQSLPDTGVEDGAKDSKAVTPPVAG